MSRAHRSPPASRRRRASRPTETFSENADGSRVLSDEEKRQLILAHAAAREGRPALGFGYYVGIAASCLVIFSGWWLTLDRNLRTDVPFIQGSGFEQLGPSLEQLQQNLDTVNASRPAIAPSGPTATQDPSAQFRTQVLENAAAAIREAALHATSSAAITPPTK